MAATVTCPNCKQPVAADSEYCVFCGMKLPVKTYVSESTPIHLGDRKKGTKKCKNGHEFDDDSLSFCPICGLPFDVGAGITISADETWKCSCGHVNPGDNEFCENCGRPKEPKVSSRISTTDVKSSTAYIPTDDDLKPKKRSNRI